MKGSTPTTTVVVDLPTNRNVEIRDHVHFPELCFEIFNGDPQSRFVKHASHFPYSNHAADQHIAWLADNGSWVYRPPAPLHWCLFPYATPSWVTFLRQALVRDIPSLQRGHNGWNACMISWERGHIASSSENALSYVPPGSTVAMVILGADPGANEICTTVTVAPASSSSSGKDVASSARTLRRKCRPGTVLLWRGRSSWTKWAYTFDSDEDQPRYYRVCFYHVDPLTFPVHDKPYKVEMASSLSMMVPATGMIVKGDDDDEKKNERASGTRSKMSFPPPMSIAKKRKLEKK